MITLVAAIGSILLACIGLAGIMIRFGLVPYADTVIGKPIRTRLDTVQVQVASVLTLANDSNRQVHVIVEAWDYHLASSMREHDRIWEQMQLLEHQVNRIRLQGLGDVPAQRPRRKAD